MARMATVREFLRQQRSAIAAEIEPLEQKLHELKAELDDVNRAERALDPSQSPWDELVDDAVPTRGVLREGTIKDFVVRVLSERPRGLVAVDILSAINRRFGTDYPRTSLSPQLSRLKQEGVLDREGLVWRIAKEKGPTAGPVEPDSSSGAGAGAQGADSHPSPAGSTPVGSTASLPGWNEIPPDSEDNLL
jgi:hypothetical protein